MFYLHVRHPVFTFVFHVFLRTCGSLSLTVASAVLAISPSVSIEQTNAETV
jgi:protein-S-isoprenylcysteine O-methyltransferase Ste14